MAALAAAAALGLAPTAAYATHTHGGSLGGGGGGGSNESGGVQGQTISATAGGVQFDTSHNGTGAAGPVTPVGDWTPPACWYAPTYTPQQFKQENQSIWSEPSVGYEWANAQRDRYQNGHPYTDFNMKKTGQGYWWTGVPNPDRIGDPDALSCNQPPFWVDNGQPPPPVQNAVTPQVLAGLAYAKIRVPGTTVTLNPSGIQTVNLNTWAWLDKATFKPVSVTASVPVLGISATTTATPVALHIDPGTRDADVYPASGDCPVNPDGGIGTPYRPADGNNVPPCGLTYLHSTTSTGPFPFRATLTWKISWTGTGGAGGNLPDGTFGTTTPVTVQEVQTVVR